MKQFGANVQMDSNAEMEPITQSNYPNANNSRFSRHHQKSPKSSKNVRPISLPKDDHEATMRTEKEFNKTGDYRSPGNN